MITLDKIKKAYDEFDEFYEAAEISPHGAAYRYFEAGVRWAEKYLTDSDEKDIVYRHSFRD